MSSPSEDKKTLVVNLQDPSLVDPFVGAILGGVAARKPFVGKPTLVDSKDAPAKFGISGKPLGYEDAIVETRSTMVEGLLALMMADKGATKATYVGTWRKTRNLDIPTLYAEQGQGWRDFCDDLVLFAVSSRVLFGTPIPIVPLE